MNLKNISGNQDPMSADFSFKSVEDLIFQPKCIRIFGSICGEYSSQTLFGRTLVLRVDVEPRWDLKTGLRSPSMNRISGDFYKRYFSAGSLGKPPKIWDVYQESWIVDTPTIEYAKCAATITGKVRFWKDTHPATDIRVHIPWESKIGPAEVTFQPLGGTKEQYTCNITSDCFRSMNLEADVCKSVNSEPILPSYDTHSHSVRPVDLTQRTLNIEKAYWEAGVKVAIRSSERTIIDDSNPKFSSWSDAELHDAMEQYFSQYPGTWPKWEMWGLLAGSYDNSDTSGIMFDCRASWGAGKPPERQGFAVFRKHLYFDKLVPGTPANDAQADAMRNYLYCWVHEAGHAFNLAHSFLKDRPCALSWMNYPYKYDANNQCSPGSFWSKFMMNFDDQELIHIRHGDLKSVIMGGDQFVGIGGSLEVPSSVMAPITGEMPLELLIRSKEYFDLMEPVIIELRLRNLMDVPIAIEEKLKPEFGSTALFIQRPDGKIVEFDPAMCRLAVPSVKALNAPGSGTGGVDRHSDTILISYGANGFYFDMPGEYLIRAVYNEAGLLIPSNVQRIRIGSPSSRESDVLANDFFTYPVGMSLYLHGSRSPYLAEGMKLLTSLAEKSPSTMLGAKIASRIAPSIGRPFFRIEKNALTMTHEAEPEKAIKMTDPAVELYRGLKGDQAKLINISYHKLIRGRAKFLTEMGKKRKAKKEISDLKDDLEERGVNESVLDDIKDFENTL